MYHQSKWSSGKSVLLILLMVCSLIFGASVGSAEAASATLAWNAAPGVSGYKVHYGTTSRTYTGSLNAGQATAYTVSNLTTGTKYYFAVTSYDSTGIESDYSNEVSTGSTSLSCTYSISPSSASFTSSGGTGSIAVGTTSGCSWSASTGVTWATITSGSSGSGSGTLSYKVAANTGSARSASFSVAGKTFTISQSAASSGTTGYTIAVNYAGTGSGTVTVSPKGPYAKGTYVTLTAVPGTNSVFAGWSGLCSGSKSTTCSGTVYSNYTATATFNASSTTTTGYTITVKYAGTGSGTVTLSPTGPYAKGTYVTLTAVPKTGSVFAGWSGLCSGSTKTTCSGYVYSNYTATATFK